MATCKVEILTGPPRSGKTPSILAEIVPFILENRCAEILLIVPSNLKADELRETLISQEGVSGFLGLKILTFLDLTLSTFQASAWPGRVNTPLARKWTIQTLLTHLPCQALKEVRETPGFLNLAAELIRTLKEGGITPEAFLKSVRSASSAPKILELGKVYEQYEKRRSKRNLLDREDLFDLAAQRLTQPQESPFFTVKRIFVTGFYDFTPLQLKLLLSLSSLPNMETLTLTLSHTPDTGRARGVTQRTLDRLNRAFPAASVRSPGPGTPDTDDPLRHLNRHWLAPPGTVRPIPSGNAIRILQAPGAYREVEEIARTIRSLILEKGYHLKDFALVFRTMDHYQDKIREIFRSYKIPHRMTAGLPLGQNPLIQAVLGMLEVRRSRFQRDAVVRLLRSHAIRFDPLAESPITAERLDILSREAMIHGGLEEWKSRLASRTELLNQRLKSLETGLTDSDEVDKAGDRIGDLRQKIGHYQICAGIMDALFSTLRSLPSRAALSRFVETLEQMMGNFHMEEQIYPFTDLRLICRDQGALRKFQDLLRQMVQDHETIHSGEEIPLSEFIRILQITLADASYSPDPLQEDAVLVTDALGIRDLHRPVVFIGGLVEESFPRPHPPDPCIDEKERLRLNRTLGPDRWLPLAAHWREEEEVLFLFSAAAATETLYLTYPRTDAQARDLLPSPYLDRVRSLFEPRSIDEKCIPLKDPLPERDRIFRKKEFLEYTFRALCRPASQERQAPALFNALIRSDGKAPLNVLHGLHVNRARDRGEGAYRGLLGSEAADLLKQDERAFSATALENYGSCPFKYFCEKELKLQPVQEVEEEIGALDMGSLYHRILECFYRAAGGPVTEANLEERKTLMHGILEKELSRAEYKGVPGHQKMWEIRKLEVHQTLGRFLKQEAAEFKKSGEIPTHFEASFGMVRYTSGDPLSTEKPFVLSADSGPIRLMGKVDRIDVGETDGRPFFSIVDYKSGTTAPGPSAILNGGSLQLPLYAEWGKQALPDAGELRRGCFYLLKQGERKCQIPGSRKISREALWDAARGFIRHYVSAIRRGEFPLTEKKCPDYCRYGHLCRIGEER